MLATIYVCQDEEREIGREKKSTYPLGVATIYLVKTAIYVGQFSRFLLLFLRLGGIWSINDSGLSARFRRFCGLDFTQKIIVTTMRSGVDRQ